MKTFIVCDLDSQMSDDGASFGFSANGFAGCAQSTVQIRKGSKKDEA